MKSGRGSAHAELVEALGGVFQQAVKVSAHVFVGNHAYDDARGPLQDRYEGKRSSCFDRRDGSKNRSDGVR
jgi:hypothetical protein